MCGDTGTIGQLVSRHIPLILGLGPDDVCSGVLFGRGKGDEERSRLFTRNCALPTLRSSLPETRARAHAYGNVRGWSVLTGRP